MYNLSKSRYITGLCCPKILWLNQHKPDEKINDEDTSALEAGIKVGELARSYFGEYKLVPYDDNKKIMLEKTESLLAEATNSQPMTICEATFSSNGNFCMVDILRIDNNEFEIIEVKSTTSVKSSHFDDMAYQYYVLQSNGYKITKVSLMHINSDYERNGPLELDKLFTVVDCSKEVIDKQKDIKINIERIIKKASSHEEPVCSIDQCCFDNDPVCPYKLYCLRNLPEENIFNISGKALKIDKKLELYNRGIVSLSDLLTSDENLSPDALLQVECETKKLPPQINKEALEKYFLDNVITFPVYHLDFESFTEVIPSFDRQRPYQHIPFQYSIHIQKKYFTPEDDKLDNELEHLEFIAQTGTDPRRSLAERLCSDIPENVCVMAYNMSYEKSIIKELALLFPDLSEHLMCIYYNIIDLIIPFRKRAWYSYKQRGSDSLKFVVPAMFPDKIQFDYNALNLIHNGGEAMKAFPELPFKTPEEQEKIRAALLAYCHLDTLVMVKILQNLFWLNT